MKWVLFILANLLASTCILAADGPCVIPGRGPFKSTRVLPDCFGAFAHNHLIEAERLKAVQR
jgi:hypothetical protein